MRIRCADHVTPLYPQKLALTSPNGGGRSVGIVRSRTKATEFSLVDRRKLINGVLETIRTPNFIYNGEINSEMLQGVFKKSKYSTGSPSTV